MASTSSTTRRRRRGAQDETPAETPKSALTELARRSARIEIAACTALAKTLADWAQAADRLAQSVGDELLRRVDGETDSPELVAHLMAATSSHLRELSSLPRAATDQFDVRLAGAPTEN
jgi:hypothetical protein